MKAFLFLVVFNALFIQAIFSKKTRERYLSSGEGMLERALRIVRHNTPVPRS